MPKLIVNEFLTLDGVMQAPGLPDEDRSGGFEHGGWQMPYFDDIFGRAIMEASMPQAASSSAAGPTRSSPPIGRSSRPTTRWRGPSTRCRSSSSRTTLSEPLPWQNSTLISGRCRRPEIAKLKEQAGKDIQVIGSGELVQTLMQHEPHRRVPADDPSRS